MVRHRGRPVRLRSALAIAATAAVLFSACSATSESVDTESGGLQSGALESEEENPASPDTETDGDADDPADGTSDLENEVVTDDALGGGSEIVNDGPVGNDLLFPGDLGYLEALGVAGVRVTRTTEQGTEVTEFDRTGTAYGTTTYATGQTVETWLDDGEIYELKDGQSLPRLYGVGLIRPDASIAIFIKSELIDMLRPGDEVVDDDGNPRREHRADADALLEFHEAEFPEQWEFRSIELVAFTNPAGGLVSLEYRQEFLLVPPENMVNPPPPKEETRTVAIEVEALAEPVTFPADGPHPDTDEHLVTEVLRRAETLYDQALSNPEPVTSELIQTVADINESPVLRFVDGFTDFESADQDTIGYASDGVLILQAKSGKWFCIAGRLSLSEPTRYTTNDDGSFGEKFYLEASGDVVEDVAFDCRQQRTDFIGLGG